MWLNLAYFVAGAFACGFWLLAPGVKRALKEMNKPKRAWTRITSLQFSWDYDYDITELRKVEQVVRDISYFMVEEIKKDNAQVLRQTDIKPGSYTIRIGVNANFIQRDDEARPPQPEDPPRKP